MRTNAGTFGAIACVVGLVAACALAAGDPPVGETGPMAEGEVVEGSDGCSIDLSLRGQMWDVLDNVITRTMDIPAERAKLWGEGALARVNTGEDLLRAAAEEFGVDEAKLAAEVRRMKHVNCAHGPIRGADGVIETRPDDGNEVGELVELTPFARDVALHVVLHEIGHALVREFDLPVLANEETMADAFATHYLAMHMPERALDAISARVSSLMIEAGEVPRAEWPVRGEHDHDARRAYQIAALAMAADREKYKPVAELVGMSASDIRAAVDYGAEIHRSWRRVLVPLWMPDGMPSNEAGVAVEFEETAPEYASYRSLMEDVESAFKKFDWHSSVKVKFVRGEGRAAWSRTSRTITVHSEYLRRFVGQGRKKELMGQSE